jgi:hypothetical protein
MDGMDGMMSTITEINKMNPKPDFFCITGDMINHANGVGNGLFKKFLLLCHCKIHN